MSKIVNDKNGSFPDPVDGDLTSDLFSSYSLPLSFSGKDSSAVYSEVIKRERLGGWRSQYYQQNIKPKQLDFSTYGVQVSDSICMECEVEPQTVTMEWQMRTNPKGNRLLFKPHTSIATLKFAHNKDERGRYNYMGKGSIAKSAVVVPQDKEPVFNINNDLSFPALAIQRPNVKQVQIKKEAQVAPLPENTLLMRFGSYARAVNEHNDEVFIENNLLIYRDSLVLATRVTRLGVKHDCSAYDYYETLSMVDRSSITPESLEPNMPGFKNIKVNYFTYPEPLIMFTKTDEGEKVRRVSSLDKEAPLLGFYDFIKRVVEINRGFNIVGKYEPVSSNSSTVAGLSLKDDKSSLGLPRQDSHYFSVSASKRHTG